MDRNFWKNLPANCRLIVKFTNVSTNEVTKCNFTYCYTVDGEPCIIYGRGDDGLIYQVFEFVSNKPQRNHEACDVMVLFFGKA
jgi:hypothetical protein